MKSNNIKKKESFGDQNKHENFATKYTLNMKTNSPIEE